MRYFKAENLTKIYTDRAIIDQLSFSIEKGQKIALVAKNGGGKTTLIKLMLWELDPTDGKVEFRKGLKIWSLSQEFLLDPEKTVADEVFETDHCSAQLIRDYEELLHNPAKDSESFTKLMVDLDEHQIRDYQSKVDTILAKLQLQDLLSQQIKTLSWWEKKRVALAKTLIDEPEFLILDEPTNHLDLQMIERLEKYLKTEHCTLFLVTHDRYFLENVCDQIFELERGQIFPYPAKYEYFLRKQAERHQNEQIATEKMRQLLKRELAWIRKSPRARATKQHFREKEFYALESRYDDQKELLHSESSKLELPLQERKLGTKILKVKHLKKQFWSKVIVQDFSYDFKFHERVGILGKNGVGKTTFISLLLWKISADAGTIETGKTVVFGEYQQDEQEFPPQKRVIDIITEEAPFLILGNGEKLSATKLLENFLFPPSQQYRFAYQLSGGEKRRLALLKVLIKNPNFLILDEPTNDLDLLTISILEDFLSLFQGCLIIISHDRSFMDRIVDHLFIFEGEGKITDFWGTYSEWHALQEQKKPEILPQVPLTSSGLSSSFSAEESLSFEQKLELTQLMKDLEVLEEEKLEITKFLENKDLAYDEITLLSEHLGELHKQIGRKEARRFELSSLSQ